MCFLLIASHYSWKSAMNFKTYLIVISLLTYVNCDVKRVSIPRSLRRCLRNRDRSFPMTDEQISNTCLLEFLWSNRQICDKVSKKTFDWLSSLVKKSQQQPNLTSLHARSNPQTTINSPPIFSTSTPPPLALSTTATKAQLTTTLLQQGSSNLLQTSTTTSQQQLQSTTSQPQMTASQPRQRKEYRMLTDAERNAYHKAINDLKADTSVPPNKYDALAKHHESTGTTAHRGIGFAGWHRYYLVLYELALQEKNPNVMLPYWDSTLDSAMDTPTDTVVFTDKFLGNGNGEVITDPFGNWVRKIERSVGSDKSSKQITKQAVETLINNSGNQRTFVSDLENLHNGPHGWIGGDMKDVASAPFDPIFYMHHAFIDCIWERYREREKQNGQNPEMYPSDSSDNLAHQSSTLLINLPHFNNVPLTNADGYKNFWTEIYYTCAPQPSCSVNKPNCGSKWLKCDIFEGRGRCVSRGSEAALPNFTAEEVFEVHNRLSSTSPTNNESMRKVPLPQGFSLVFPSGSRGQPGSAGVSGRKITAEEFFSALKTLKKEPITIANTPRFKIKSETHGNQRPQRPPGLKGRPGPNGSKGIPGRPGPPSNINTQQLPQRMPSIDRLKIPKFQKVCGGNPIQNFFRLDCKVGIDLWVFVPVKVVNLRHGDIVYSSFPVNLEGRKLNNTDVFSVGQQLAFASNLQSKARSKHKPCSYEKSGLFKVKISSYGLNYNGIYEDTVFLDNRRTVSTEISYLGIRNPEKSATRVFITAVDECGIACQPMILIRGRQKRRFFRYRKTKGAIEITAKGPMYYSNTYRGAESLVWRADTFSVPQPDENQIPIVFVCDYRSKNPWS